MRLTASRCDLGDVARVMLCDIELLPKGDFIAPTSAVDVKMSCKKFTELSSDEEVFPPSYSCLALR